ncbi:MAG: hypothetical protein QXY52_07020 [Conexivisphaerales archaeon]
MEIIMMAAASSIPGSISRNTRFNIYELLNIVTDKFLTQRAGSPLDLDENE